MRSVEESFQRFYRRAPEVIGSAPGTVLLLGDDTAHGQGLVLGMAAPMRVRVAAAARGDRRAFVRSTGSGGEIALSLDSPDRTWGWADHVSAAAASLEAEGLTCPGFEMLFEGEVPQHVGFGSSVALSMAATVALDALGNFGLEPMKRAWLCWRAYHSLLGAGEPLTSAAIAAAAREGCAVLVDEEKPSADTLELPLREHRIVVIDSGIRRPASTAEASHKRSLVERALEALQQRRPELRRLRDATGDELDGIEAPLAARARRASSEALRVSIAKEALEEGELSRLGTLMTESHDSLRLHAGVTPPELDGLVRLAQTSPGVLGARLMREGEGGSVVALVAAESVAALRERVEARHYRRFGRQGAIWEFDRAGGPASID